MRWLLYTGLLLVLVLAVAGCWIRTVVVMPGESYYGPLDTLSETEQNLSDRLRRDVEMLAVDIGERNVANYSNLVAAATAIDSVFTGAGYIVQRQSYTVDGTVCQNLEVEIPGTSRKDEIVVIGGHYDSAPGTPGANDNATGVAATLALARMVAGKHFARTVRFVAFVNEEPPYFQTADMGSLVYARRCRQRGEKIVGMLSMETMGYYSDRPGSQQYPFPLGMFYPSSGNFIAFVSDRGSMDLLHRTIGTFRSACRFPSEGAAAPASLPGIGWSDHWSFWQVGYPAVMVTDTAPFRYPFYHTPDDTPDTIDYDRLARAVTGLKQVLIDLAN